MRVITAPEEYIAKPGDITVFLAGGISNCATWQEEVIKELKDMFDLDKDNGNKHTKELVVFNPRRDNFPMDDPTAAEKQIRWEYKHLEMCKIFSMYFCAGESDQPICMYELGRNLVRMNEKYGIYAHNVISVEDGYKRAQDVGIQTEITPYGVSVRSIAKGDYHSHARRIYLAFLDLEIYDYPEG